MATPETLPSLNGHAPAAQWSATATKRREQVIEAATDIIATQGIHKLSLGNIEKRVKMTRGHLTYYFPTKDAILRAVFERMLARMIDQAMKAEGPKPGTGQMWDVLPRMFACKLEPPTAEHRAFLSLIHTFHAQTSYRDDVKQRLATLHADWRAMMAADYEKSVRTPAVPPAIAASLVMALMQGLGGQLAVDDAAFDKDEMLRAVLNLIAPLFADRHPTGEPS